MEKFAVFCGSILALLVVASVLCALGLPGYQAVTFTIFGACLAGMFAFMYFIVRGNAQRPNSH